ncbi:hypothetical protein [Duganella sp. HH105]|nr:hypothetical protein [Duganella sp. HH105]
MTTLLYIITGIGMAVGLGASIWLHLETRKMQHKKQISDESKD